MELLDAFFVNNTGFPVAQCQQCGTDSEKEIPNGSEQELGCIICEIWLISGYD